MTIRDCMAVLERLAPLHLAESWDNVGLLIGDEAATVTRVMTCLTLTPDVAEEAIAEGAELIVTHHPVLFRPVQRLTSATAEGAMLLKLIRAGVAVYSAHTAYDSAAGGINEQIAGLLGLRDCRPLRMVASSPDAGIGAGRWGRLASSMTLQDLAAKAAKALGAPAAEVVGDPDRAIGSVAIACGAGAELLPDALAAGCDAFLTGEARFHSCLEARTAGIAMILVGHYASERGGMETLAKRLQQECSGATVWASRRETSPIC